MNNQSVKPSGNQKKAPGTNSNVRAMNRRYNNNNNRRNGEPRNVLAPAAQAQGYLNKEPQISASAKECRIRHRELLATVNGATSFTVQNSLILNPGISSTFPWLSVQAKMWEQYRFERLSFHYLTRCSTTKVGSVILSPDYDSLDGVPSTELIAAANRDTCEDASWKNITVNLSRDALHPMGPKKYIRTGAVLGDLKTYDGGRLHVCVTEQDDTSAIGKLWVEYDVRLFVPQIDSAPSSASRSSVFSADGTQTTTTSTVTPMTGSWDVNPLGISESSGTFTPPAGAYLVFFNYTGNDSSVETFRVNADIRKNGTIVQTKGSLGILGASSSNVYGSNICCTGYVVVNGTDTVTCNVTMVGAAGTLLVYSGQVIFALA